MPAISIQHVTKLFGAGPSVPSQREGAAVWDITLEIEEGELVVLLGPSGCGKTTLMRMVNRLIEPTSGHIFVNGEDVERVSATELRRHIGYVIQQVGLFPHMTVAQNIAVVPKLLGWPKSHIRSRTQELLELVDLPPERFLRRYPSQLSGGQQQRVGIARAMAADPAVLLMDEPFGAIDAITRTDLQNELLNIQRKIGKTIMFVTHDVEEALRLAGRIAVMRAGEVVQYDTPLNILTHPADAFVRALLDTGDIFRQLSLIPIRSLMSPSHPTAAGGLTVDEDTDARSALSNLIAHGADEATVLSAEGNPVGTITLEGILARGAQTAEQTAPSGV